MDFISALSVVGGIAYILEKAIQAYSEWFGGGKGASFGQRLRSVYPGKSP